MGPLRIFGTALVLFVIVSFSSRSRGWTQAQTQGNPIDHAQIVFGESAAVVLDREFTGGSVSYLLLDAKSGKVLTSHWESENQPTPLGSLVKPFTALAYAEAHGYQFPVHDCGGKAGGCWQAQSHGKLNISSALSLSCNSYFRYLARDVSEEQIDFVAALFDLEPPAQGAASTTFIGLGEQWQISPLRMAHAYLELCHRKDQAGIRELITGMRLSAQHGTGAAAGRALKHPDVLIKTGTAFCTHSPRAPGDGFVIALAPANDPQILLMIRVHGVPGAKAAETAGRMLSRMEE